VSEQLVTNGFVVFMTPFIVLCIYFLAFWVGYRVVKAAVANGVREALGVARDDEFKNVLKQAIAEAIAEAEPGSTDEGAVYVADFDEPDQGALATDSEHPAE
jgi:hypothetical protein